ncbi:MAG: cation:proton antiporter subunit C, partial [Rhodospirillales bacterium]|nr:cation:proton antiporter subunit C [Rhodospirillales bacterium]
FSNPLPHVLILTAIVVGIATTALGLALVVRIKQSYDTIEEDEIQKADEEMEFGKPSGDSKP